MASLDVTPQELRDIEIREAWRGYHRDDVDELLERAAATIEHLEDDNRRLKARVAGSAANAAPMATPAPVATPAPAPAPAPATAPPMPRSVETDVIQRTLVLAQKAADEAVAEARAKAQQMLAESESKATQLVAEAEAAARRIADAERAKLEADIAKLSTVRNALNSDVEALERFEREYRTRLRVAIEAELDLLGSTGKDAPERPELHHVELPDSQASWSASEEVTTAVPATPAAPAAPLEPRSSVHIAAAPAEGGFDASSSDTDRHFAEPAGGWDAAPVETPMGDDAADGESLDDDAFFASLREAVRDETVLGGTDLDDSKFLEPTSDPDDDRHLFRRRR